jgi:hypothetical protein
VLAFLMAGLTSILNYIAATYRLVSNKRIANILRDTNFFVVLK